MEDRYCTTSWCRFNMKGRKPDPDGVLRCPLCRAAVVHTDPRQCHVPENLLEARSNQPKRGAPTRRRRSAVANSTGLRS
jgi:hypothetical protein